MTECAVCVVVLAARGGAALATALDAVAWAGERAVLDPLGMVRALDLPPGVRLERRVDALALLGTMPWVLLLVEDEAASVSPAAVAQAIATGPATFRPRFELETLGVRFAMPAASVRLAPRSGCRMVLDRGDEPGLAAPYPARSLEAVIRVPGGDTVAEAFDAVQARGRVVSGVLAQLAATEPGIGVLPPLAALARVLRARADRPAGLARWVAAVFAGYRVVLGRAQWWEWRHAQPAVVREVG